MEKIKELEKELIQIVNKDKQSWTHFYLIMKDIEEQQLWKELGERSFTSWVKNFSIKNKIHESIIWSRKKAGKVYESYQRTKEEQGEKVTPLAEAEVSADTLVLLDKINSKSPSLAAELTDKAINKEISREDLRNAYKTIRGNAETNTNTNFNKKEKETGSIESVEPKEEKEIVTAPLIVSALANSEWLGVTKTRKPFKTAFEQDKYKVFTEFPLYTGTSKKSRRVDVLIAENLTVDSWELNLHGIEIKVSKHDLLNDMKYTEYADFVDFMWLAVPLDLVEDARETKFDGCGILVINNNNIEIIEHAKRDKAILKKDTLTSIALKIL